MKKICSFLFAFLFLTTLTFADNYKASTDISILNLPFLTLLSHNLIDMQSDWEQNSKILSAKSDLPDKPTKDGKEEPNVHRRGHRIRKVVKGKGKRSPR
jgi:hypothetical protein